MAIDTQPPVDRDAKGRPLPPPGVSPTSLKYAAIVPIVAVVMMVIVIAINVTTSSTPQTKAALLPHLQASSGLTAAPGSPFSSYVVAGEPTSDILSAVAIPSGVTFVGSPQTGGEATSFDKSLVYGSSASSGSLYTFFHQELAANGWKIFSTGAPVGHPGVEMLAQKAGSDGWYWEAGVIISPTTFHGSTQSTTFTYRLYQASSDS